MKLHRYFGTHTHGTLIQKRLKLSVPSELNDPFEFLYQSAGQMTIDKARAYVIDKSNSDYFYKEWKKNNPLISRDEFRNHMITNLETLALVYYNNYHDTVPTDPEFCHQLADKHFRIACFTSTDIQDHEEILMWSHYAAKHTGIRLTFDINVAEKSKFFVKKVCYSRDVVGIDFTDKDDFDSLKNGLIAAISTKSLGWSYEQEYRLFCIPSMCLEEVESNGTKKSFISFDSSDLVGIDFGLKCPQDQVDKISLLARANYSHAILRKAGYDPSRFAIKYEIL